MSNVHKIEEETVRMEQAKTDEFEERVGEIADWWGRHAAVTISRTTPKAIQYGASDLDLMGQAMVGMMGDRLDGATDEEKAQYGRYAATAFYALGKVARIFGALEQGVLPHPDSEFDLEVYSVMMTRIRDTGRWV
jgi:hypothetical protein